MPAKTELIQPQTPAWATRAAVLSMFDLDSITAVDTLGEASQAELVSFLDSCCEQVIDETGRRRWQLRDTERARVLRETPLDQLRRALENVPARAQASNQVQAALAQYVSGLATPLEELDAAGLRARLQLERWTGRPAAAGGESREDIRARLEWLTLTEPLRRLSAGGLVGRSGLLGELRGFIRGGSNPGEHGSRKMAFLIEGAGGVGKSSLLAQLLPARPRPDYLVAYLSFDRGWLLDNGGWSLLDEIVRQVGLQLPASRREHVTVLRRAARKAAEESEAFRDQASREAQTGWTVDPRVIAPLAYLLRRRGNDARLIVVLDALEELARRGDAVSLGIFRFLDQLHRSVRAVRVVGAGRALPRIALETCKVVSLTGLDPDEAIILLDRLTADTAVSAGTLREVISLVEGNPLSLQLAADVLNRTDRNPAQVLAAAQGNVEEPLYAQAGVERLISWIGHQGSMPTPARPPAAQPPGRTEAAELIRARHLDRDLDRDFRRAHALARDLDRTLTRARAYAHARDRGVAHDLDGALTRARVRALDLDRTLERALGIALAIARDFNRFRDFARAIARDIDIAHDRVRALSRAIDLDNDLVLGNGPLAMSQVNAFAQVGARAYALTRALNDLQIDASGADLSGMKIRYIAVLDGIIWTRGTIWPPDIADQVEEHSEEIVPGVYQVRLGDALDRDRDKVPVA
jgi:hypothetical protein